MKTKIAILGSTGSIGKTLLDIIRKDHKKFEIILLTADKNYKLLLKQAKEFKVKNLIITNKKKFDLIKNNSIKLNLNIYNNFVNFSKIFTNKVDYTMSSITGIKSVLFFFNSLLIKFHPHIIDSLLAIPIFLVYLIIFNVGSNPLSPEMALIE